MDTTQPNNHVIIIGGGIAGLTAACLLAQSGVPVTLYERSSDLGGRASTEIYDGFAFNRGIHALYSGGAADKTLKELKIAYTGYIPDPSRVRVLTEGALYSAPLGMMSLIGTRLLSAADKFELTRIFATLPQINARDLRHVSVNEWIESHAQRPRVRQFLKANAYTAVYSAGLDLVSADVFIEKTQIIFKHPIIYIDGGWQTLVDGLRQTAEAAGAHIVTGTRVEAVMAESGVTGVRLADGQIITATQVIVATPPQEAAKVTGAIYPQIERIVDDLVPAQVACLDVALRRLPNPNAPIVQDMDQPRFLSTQSLYSQVAPEGSALIYSFKQLDPRQPSDPHEDEKDLEQFLDAVQPGWRDLVVKRRYLPRINAVGALPLAKTGGFAGRPQAIVPQVEGLYLVGDWIGDEGFLIDASAASAKQAVQHIQQTQRVLA
jgi:phytoene dehydrogenase-like protein